MSASPETPQFSMAFRSNARHWSAVEIQLIGPAGPIAGWRGSKDELAERIVEQLEALGGAAPPVADAG